MILSRAFDVLFSQGEIEMFILLPGHNKDYETEKETKEAFDNNIEFLCCGPDGDVYCNKTKLERDLGKGFYVNIIYCQMSKIIKVEV